MDKLSKEEIEREGTGTKETGAEEAPGIPVKRKRGRPRSLNGAIKVKDVVEAVYKTGGRIEDTCKIIGLTLPNFYKKFRHNEKVEEALNEARNIGFELVTDVLLDQALKGDSQAMKLYLKYNPVARANNWTDSQILTIREDKPLTDEEKKNLAKELFG